MTEIVIVTGYIIGDSKEEMQKADELYKEFNKRFLKVFPKAKLSYTHISKSKKDSKEKSLTP